MAYIYERMPHFTGQKIWSEKTPLSDVYKLQSNNPHNKQKAEIHKDSGQRGIKFTFDKTINDFVCRAEKVDLDYTESFLEFENVRRYNDGFAGARLLLGGQFSTSNRFLFDQNAQ